MMMQPFCDYCGRIIVGRCSKDNRLVCHFHSGSHQGYFLCWDCLKTSQSDEAYPSVQLILEEVRNVCSAVAQMLHPYDRLFILLMLTKEHGWTSELLSRQYHYMRGRDPLAPDPSYARDRFTTEFNELIITTAKEVLPSTTGEWTGAWSIASPDPAEWTFDPARLTEHWLQTDQLRNPQLMKFCRWDKGWFGGIKRVVLSTATCWRISQGNDGSDRGSYGHSSPGRWLLGDGTVIRSHPSEPISISSIEDKREPLTWRDAIGLYKHKSLTLLPLLLTHEERSKVLLESLLPDLLKFWEKRL